MDKLKIEKENKNYNYDFSENVDFTTYSQNCEKPKGGRPTIY